MKISKTFEIKTETLIHAIVLYRVKAEDEHQALKLLPKSSPYKIIPQHLNRIQFLKATIYEAGKSIIKLTKYFR